MAISIEKVKHISHLARLQLSEAELIKYQKELGVILNYIDRLNDFDIDEAGLFRRTIESSRVYRADKIEVSLAVKEALKNAPIAVEGMFNVPKVI